MPRIYKGNEIIMKLLVHTCTNEGEISDLKIALYTTDPNNAIEFTDRYTINGSIVTLTVPNYAFGTMEDGVVSYIAQGLIDDDTFYTKRQSNYYLKTPIDYTPTEIPEEVKLETIATAITQNGPYTITPSEGYNGIEKVDIDVNVDGSAVLSEKIDTPTIESVNFDNSIVYVPEEGVDGFNRVVVYVDNLKVGWYEQGYEDGKSQGGGECNLEDKIIAPETNEVDGNGYIYVYPNEGYDGMKEVALQTVNLKNGWYNEGYRQGKAEGGECTFEELYVTQNGEYIPNADGYSRVIVEVPQNGGGDGTYNVLDFSLNPDNLYYEQKFAADEGVSGWQEVIVRTGDAYNQMKEEGRNEVRNGLGTLKINDSIPNNEGVFDINEIIYEEGWVLNKAKLTFTEPSIFELKIKFSSYTNTEEGMGLELQELITLDNGTKVTYNGGGIRVEGSEQGNLPYEMYPYINEVTLTKSGEFNVNGNIQYIDGLLNGATTLTIGPMTENIISVNVNKNNVVLERFNLIKGEYIKQPLEFKKYKDFGWNRVEFNLDGIRFGQSTFTEVPKWVNLDSIQDYSFLFYECKNLQTTPDFKPKGSMESTFEGCSSFVFDAFICDDVTEMKRTFYNCKSLLTCGLVNSQNVKTFFQTFSLCSKLRSLAELNCSGIDENIFQAAELFNTTTMSDLTYMGGLKNLKASASQYGLSKCANLDRDSCIRILEGLYDFVGNGETPNDKQGVLKVHQNFLDNVGEEISIGINKGWQITV